MLHATGILQTLMNPCTLFIRDLNRKFVAGVYTHYTHTEAHGRLYFAGYANLQDIQIMSDDHTKNLQPHKFNFFFTKLMHQ